LMGGRS